MSEPSKAVFLSYASQDARGRAAYLRGVRNAGIEVWFDQNELRGGDVWDHKIRQQIHDCALFVPIISAHTGGAHRGLLSTRMEARRRSLLSDGRRRGVSVSGGHRRYAGRRCTRAREVPDRAVDATPRRPDAAGLRAARRCAAGRHGEARLGARGRDALAQGNQIGPQRARGKALAAIVALLVAASAWRCWPGDI